MKVNKVKLTDIMTEEEYNSYMNSSILIKKIKTKHGSLKGFIVGLPPEEDNNKFRIGYSAHNPIDAMDTKFGRALAIKRATNPDFILKNKGPRAIEQQINKFMDRYERCFFKNDK